MASCQPFKRGLIADKNSEEHVQLIERAKALLAREKPVATLGELHLEAMKMFVAALEKRKFAVTERPQKPDTKPPERDQRQGFPAPHQPVPAVVGRRESSEVPRQRGAVLVDRRQPSDAPRQRGAVLVDRRQPSDAPRQRGAVVDRRQLSDARLPPSETPRPRARYVAAAVRREVYRRDGGRCTYVDARGERCCETRYLELHHLQPFARQGAHVAANLALRCAAHNQRAAEQDFGSELMARKRDSLRHEALGTQIDASAKR